MLRPLPNHGPQRMPNDDGDDDDDDGDDGGDGDDKRQDHCSTHHHAHIICQKQKQDGV